MRDGKQVGVAHPECYEDPSPLRHVRDPSACVRNPALGDLEVAVDEEDAAMDVGDYKPD